MAGAGAELACSCRVCCTTTETRLHVAAGGGWWLPRQLAEWLPTMAIGETVQRCAVSRSVFCATFGCLGGCSCQGFFTRQSCVGEELVLHFLVPTSTDDTIPQHVVEALTELAVFGDLAELRYEFVNRLSRLLDMCIKSCMSTIADGAGCWCF